MQDYDACKLEVHRIAGGSRLSWTFRFGESKLSDNTQTSDIIQVSGLTLTPSSFTADADGALSPEPSLAEAKMSFKTPSAAPTPELRYKDMIEILYGASVIFQGIVTQVSVAVSLSDFNTYDHEYSYSMSDITGGMVGTSPGLPSVPAENPVARLTRAGFTVDTSLTTSAQLNYILALTAAAQDDTAAKTHLEWLREFVELTEVPIRVTPDPIGPIWSRVQIFPHPVKWNGVDPTPDVTSDGCWINSLVEQQAAETFGELLPTSVQVVANEVMFLTGFEHLELPPALLGIDFIVGVARLGTSGDVPFGVGAGSVLDIYGDTMVIKSLTHSFEHKKLVTSLELTKPVSITT